MVRVETPISSANWDVVAQTALRVARVAGTVERATTRKANRLSRVRTTGRALLRFEARQPPPLPSLLANGQLRFLPGADGRLLAHQRWVAALAAELPRQGLQLSGAGMQAGLAQGLLSGGQYIHHQAIAAGGGGPLLLRCGEQLGFQMRDQSGRKARIRSPRALRVARAVRSRRRQVSRLMLSIEAIATWLIGVGSR